MKIKNKIIIYCAILIALISLVNIRGVKAYSIYDSRCDEYNYSTREEMASTFIADFNYFCGLGLTYESMLTKLNENVTAFEEPIYNFFNNQDMQLKWSWINNYFLASSNKYSLRVQTQRVVDHEKDAVEYWVIALINLMQGNDLSSNENIGIDFSKDTYKSYIKNDGYWIMIRYLLPNNSDTIYDYTYDNSVKSECIYMKNFYLINSELYIDYHDIFFTENIKNDKLFIKSIKFTNASTPNDVSNATVVSNGTTVDLTYTSDDEYNCFYVVLDEKRRVDFEFVQNDISIYSDYIWCEPGSSYEYMLPELPISSINKLEDYYTNSYYIYSNRSTNFKANSVFNFEASTARSITYKFDIVINSRIEGLIIDYHKKNGSIEAFDRLGFFSWQLFFSALYELTDSDVIEMFQSESFCEHEKIGIYYRNKLVYKINSKKAFSSNGKDFEQALITAVESSQLEDTILHIDFYVMHDDFYYGPTFMYKNTSAIFTPNDIKNMLASFYLDCECYNSSNIEYDFSSYIGYADSNGKYPIYISVKNQQYKFEVICTNKINGDYYFNSTLGYSISNNLTVDQIVNDLKKVGILPNVALNTRFNGINQLSQNYIDGVLIAPGAYSFVVDYDSTSGYFGSVSVNLDVSSAVSNTTSDPVVSKDEIIEIIATILATIVVLSLVVWIVKKLLFTKSRRHS